MKGLELCEKFYNEFGAPMIHEKFPQIEDKLAIGLVGSGSECFGYDDEISKDHDFEPGFCIFITDDIDSKTEFALERAYTSLPSEFEGFKRTPLNPVGGNRHGVIKISDFFKSKTGKEDASFLPREWFFVPEQSLAEATNGKVFRDDLGAFTSIREKIKYFPKDMQLKKLSGNLLIMAQSGQYNYERCLRRGETGSAQLAVFEFVKSAINVIFLLNKRYIPYYKWTFRALGELEALSHLKDSLEYLISSPNDESSAKKKQQIIEQICLEIVNELNSQGLISTLDSSLENQAYVVNNRIKDAEIRNLHILYAIN